MKNIHLIPTDRGQRITKTDEGKLLWCSTLAKDFIEIRKGYLGFHLYITSDEEINQQTKPCWCINTIKNTWDKDLIYYQGAMPQYHFVGFKKIILTTDPDLIKDGVQNIDDEFLEWYVENPSCNNVEVSYGILKPFQSTNKGYIIHLPDNDVLEEPKQEYERGITITHVGKQETLEEAAEEFVNNTRLLNHKALFMEGAKWRQEQDKNKCVAGCKNFFGGEVKHHKDCFYYPDSFSKKYDDLKLQQEQMYSEEEVLWMVINNPYKYENSIKEWFETFKKK